MKGVSAAAAAAQLPPSTVPAAVEQQHKQQQPLLLVALVALDPAASIHLPAFAGKQGVSEGVAGFRQLLCTRSDRLLSLLAQHRHCFWCEGQGNKQWQDSSSPECCMPRVTSQPTHGTL